MPLLNFVGVTGMHTTIHIAPALEGDTQEDYIWVLGLLGVVLTNAMISLHQMNITDCDTDVRPIICFPGGSSYFVCLGHYCRCEEAC